jgi:hypothetical protein
MKLLWIIRPAVGYDVIEQLIRYSTLIRYQKKTRSKIEHYINCYGRLSSLRAKCNNEGNKLPSTQLISVIEAFRRGRNVA